MNVYDPENIFAKILRKEIPCDTVGENDHALAFRDISPQAPHHILVIPKGPYVSFADFSAKASDREISDLIKLTGLMATEAGLVEDGYRLLANHGGHAHQEVPHFHIHICGGKPLGPLLSGNSA